MIDLHLTTDDMPLFTKLRMTAFGALRTFGGGEARRVRFGG